VDFTFTDEQAMLRESVARYLQRHYTFAERQALLASGRPYSAAVWQHFAELVLRALPFPAKCGGGGGSVVDLVAVGEPFGEHLLVEPYVSSVLLAGGVLASAADNPAARRWLTKIMAGEALGALAHEEGTGTPDPSMVALRAKASAQSYQLDGEKRLVLGAPEADTLVVTARVGSDPGSRGGLAVLLVAPDAPGVHLTPFRTIDGRSAGHIVFDSVEVAADACVSTEAYAALTGALRDAVVALAAEAVGAMGALLRQTSDYAATRHQFGVPIGSFQVVAHRLADMKIAYTKARATLLHTAGLVEAGRATARDIAVLKAQVGTLGRSIGEAAVQTHGGIGMTDELAVGHYLKRLIAIDAMLGDADYHYRVVGASRPAGGGGGI
jgi:alkylation response protein AidB-like acyl-CoA dehydrogenase